MKNKAACLPALSVTAAAAVFALVLLPLAGCGSGSDNTGLFPAPAPIIDPVPPVLDTTPTVSDTGVIVFATYDTPNQPVINLFFPNVTSHPSSAISIDNVVEYHVYRNDVLVGRLQQAEVRTPPGEVERGQIIFLDSNRTDPVDYLTINAALPVALVQARSTNIKPFSAGAPLVYRITLLSGSPDSEGQTTYTETEIGRSNTITPAH